MKTRIINMLLMLTLLVSAVVLAVQAEQTPDAVAEAGNQVALDANSMDFSDAGNLPDYCPACGTDSGVTWTAVKTRIGDSKSGHYYIPSGGLTLDAAVNNFANAGKNATLCIHLNGQNVQYGSRIAIAYTGSTVNIMGSGNVSAVAYTGTLNNNKAPLYVEVAGTLNLYGGRYLSSDASRPIVQVNKVGGVVNMYDGAVIDGNNVTRSVVVDYGTFNMYGGVIQNGESAVNGANVRLGSADAEFNMYGGEICNGVNTNEAGTGGNVYVSAGAFTVSGGKIAGGSAIYGGNIFVDSGTVTVSGGAITDGTATGGGGNIYLYGLGSNVSKLQITGGTIEKGKLYVRGDGASMSVTGGMVDAVIMGSVANITVGEGYKKYNLSDSEAVVATDSAKAITASIDTGAVGRYDTVQAAVTAVGDGEKVVLWNETAATDYIKLAKEVSLDLGFASSVYVDLNGNTMNVTGTGILYAIDSANDAYELTDGAATIADTVTVQTDVTAPNGNRYIAIKADNGTYSFHRLNMRLTTVSLRTSACGIYYKAQYECDDVLAAAVSAYGVVFSVNNMPGEDFKTETADNNRYTVLTPDASFGDSTVATSGSIFNIMKTQYAEGVDAAAENAGRGTMPIYANAYIVVDGQTFVADSANKNKKVTDEGFSNGVAFSLLDVLKMIDTNWDKYVAAGQDGAVKDFYGAWADKGMSTWANQFENIA